MLRVLSNVLCDLDAKVKHFILVHASPQPLDVVTSNFAGYIGHMM